MRLWEGLVRYLYVYFIENMTCKLLHLEVPAQFNKKNA